MPRCSLLIATVACSLLSTSAARAADSLSGGGLGNRGNFVFGAERLVGLYIYSTSLDTQPRSAETSGTMFNLVSGNALTSDAQINPAAVPRIAFDYMITDLVSLGGSIGYMSTSGSHKDKGPPADVTTDLPSNSAFDFAARVGVVLRINDVVSFWPRGGLSYLHVSSEQKNTDNMGRATTTTFSTGAWDLSLEGMFVFSPAPHFGFSIGPIADIGIGGSVTSEAPGPNNSTVSVSSGYKITSFGASGGLVGWF